jgi:hypothetical protein
MFYASALICRSLRAFFREGFRVCTGTECAFFSWTGGDALSNIGFLGEGGNEGKGKISFSAMMRNQSVTHQNQEK